MRNPYPLPRIVDTMQQLEGFQYDTELYLNMGYYSINIFFESYNLTTIVTEFWKFRTGTCLKNFLSKYIPDKNYPC